MFILALEGPDIYLEHLLLCFLKVVVTVVSMTIKVIFLLVTPLSLTAELGESGRRGVNLSGILIFTKGLWKYLCLFLMLSQK